MGKMKKNFEKRIQKLTTSNIKKQVFFLRTFLFFGENYKANLSSEWIGDKS